MPLPQPLSAPALRRRCNPDALGFRNTDDLEPVDGLIGQDRALSALRFGVEIAAKGFNIFAPGAQGSGRHDAVRRFVDARAAQEPTPDDWVYVHNFEAPNRPRALRLPAGRGKDLADALDKLIDQLKTGLKAVFESSDYRDRRHAIDRDFQESQEASFKSVGEKAEGQGLKIVHTPQGVMIAPVHDGEIIKPEVLERMSKAERDAIEARVNEVKEELSAVMRDIPLRDRDRRQRIVELNRSVADYAVGRAFADLPAFADCCEEVHQHLQDMRAHIIEHAEPFVAPQEDQPPLEIAFNKYRANPIIHNEPGAGAPVVYADRVDLAYLVGRIEHQPHMGALLTDLTLIQSGQLHRANGGYLLIDADRLMSSPYTWRALKRALRSRNIAIESPFVAASAMTAVTLEPEPIPADVKVILFGERLTLHLLAQYDADFKELFKVAAEFDDTIERDTEVETLYCRLIAGIAKSEKIRPLSAKACAAVIDRSARTAGDSERLSLLVGDLADLLREADYWAKQRGGDEIESQDIARTVREQIHRRDLIAEKVRERILRETVLIDTAGAQVGQINGLAVLAGPGYAFGSPSRITARVRVGSGQVIDIEREAETGGASHTKGVLILSSFLAARYAEDTPLSLAASLVFEQNYGGVDGDSASSTELYALLSALAETPIKQSLAVTGSVNQFGVVQAIGGVNEKIEGFFDICQGRGLTGEQGVLIPVSNVKHLMLREDVAEACAAGRFHIYPVGHIDEGIELLTGTPAGELGPDGRYPDGSINARVRARLKAFAERRRAFAKDGGLGGGLSAGGDALA